jgi:cytochrome P450
MPNNEPPFYPPPRESGLHPSEDLVAIQNGCPVAPVRIWSGQEAWLFTRHADVRAILADSRVSANSGLPGYPSTSLAVAQTREEFPTFLQMDAPDHLFYRRMVTSDFSVKASEARREETSEIVAEAIDSLLKLSPPVDFIESFALVVPSTVISRILGVPYDDHDFFQTRSQTLISGHSTVEETAIATGEMRDYLSDLVDAKDREPGDDLLSRLVVHHMRTGELTREQVVAHARLLLTGGHDTTASMIGLGVLALLLNPDARQQLVAAPGLMQNAIEEMLRYFTITHIGRRRVATGDIEVEGVTIKAGDGIIADHFMGNRDPQVFQNPHSFDIDRDTRAHVAFGYGPHQCLGQHLARVELQVVFRQLLERIPTLRLAVPPAELSFKEEAIVYGLRELPVEW